MNGSELFLKTAAASGVKVCFTNPGTTEIPIVQAFDTVPGIRPVLCLFEGVATGAADGYGRMTDSPAMTLLHLGPGLGNGLANLHNARRAGTPMLNVIGEHALWHRPSDPPLAMDIEKLLQTVSGWQTTLTSKDRISIDTAAAIEAAGKGMIASIAFPYDLQLTDVSDPTHNPSFLSLEELDDDEALKNAASALRGNGRTALILGGRALRKDSLLRAAAIRRKTGCDLLSEPFPARVEKGWNLPALKRIPYFHQSAVTELSGYQTLILIGARVPVPFFGWPGAPSRYINENQTMIILTENPMDAASSLQALSEVLNITGSDLNTPVCDAPQTGLSISGTELTAANACAVIVSIQPDGAIVVDEGITAGALYDSASHTALPHTVLHLTGGAIGSGLPMSTGAAIACPDRRVINLQGDGSAMYTLQALWTQTRESLNITTLICANRSYDILKLELAMAGNTALTGESGRLTSLDTPPLDWISLSKGMGVPAVSVETVDQLENALRRSISEPGPSLIEMKLAKLF